MPGVADRSLMFDEDFGRLRRLCEAQQQAAELLRRARASADGIESEAGREVARIVGRDDGRPPMIGEALERIQALLVEERRTVAEVLRALEGQLHQQRSRFGSALR